MISYVFCVSCERELPDIVHPGLWFGLVSDLEPILKAGLLTDTQDHDLSLSEHLTSRKATLDLQMMRVSRVVCTLE